MPHRIEINGLSGGHAAKAAPESGGQKKVRV
jgi:hypothetical protein